MRDHEPPGAPPFRNPQSAIRNPHSAIGNPHSAILDLSLVIPAFNEESRLPRAIEGLAAYLDARQIRAEVLIVDNGSTDRTPEIADEAASCDHRFRPLHLPAPGKGRAVREGVLASEGRIVVFCDADFSMAVEGIDALKQAVAQGVDVAIASREVPGARRIDEPWWRHFQGRVFNGLVQLIALPGVRDTQCGFKAFRREAAHDLFCRQVLNGWAFDVEVLFIARQRGYSIREIPITWRYDPSSRVHPLRDTISMLRELLVIRFNAIYGRYS